MQKWTDIVGNAMKAQGIRSKAELARLMGVSRSNVCGAFHDERDIVFSTFTRMCDAIGCEIVVRPKKADGTMITWAVDFDASAYIKIPNDVDPDDYVEQHWDEVVEQAVRSLRDNGIYHISFMDEEVA